MEHEFCVLVKARFTVLVMSVVVTVVLYDMVCLEKLVCLV